MTHIDKKAVTRCHDLAQQIRRAVSRAGNPAPAEELAQGNANALLQTLIAELNGIVRREQMRRERRANRKNWSLT